MSLKAGDKAPDFEVVDQSEKKVRLSDYLGKKVALFFYPQDDTPTCTVEACNLRDNYKTLKANGYEVVGISPDPPKKHVKFIKKFKLPYRLLSDVDRKVIEAYGVWGEKELFGRKYMGVYRTTFIIDAQGVIERVIDEVKSKEHAEQILG